MHCRAQNAEARHLATVYLHKFILRATTGLGTFLQSPSHRAKADGPAIGPSPTDQKRGRCLRSCEHDRAKISATRPSVICKKCDGDVAIVPFSIFLKQKFDKSTRENPEEKKASLPSAVFLGIARARSRSTHGWRTMGTKQAPPKTA